MEKKDYYTIPELAKEIGLSRIAVYKQVRQGKIKAIRISRFWVIPKSEIENILGTVLTKEQKNIINAGIDKTIKEYGQALKLLGAE